jgi:hypothetical protein
MVEFLILLNLNTLFNATSYLAIFGQSCQKLLKPKKEVTHFTLAIS